MATSDELLAGFYNPIQRQAEIKSRLQASFDAIRKTDLAKDEDHTKKTGGQEDICRMNLAVIIGHIDDLEKEVEAYNTEHFTRLYRTLQGHCDKYQMDLDMLDFGGREDIRRERKGAIVRIDGLSKKLVRKTHSSGKSCPDCELKD